MADQEYEHVADGTPEEMATIEEAVHKAETALGYRFEARLHAIGKELAQEYELTQGFVTRVFAGMPLHVRPGSVPPYSVVQPEPVLIKESDVTEPSKGGPPDIMR